MMASLAGRLNIRRARGPTRALAAGMVGASHLRWTIMLFRLLVLLFAVAQGFNLAPPSATRAVVARSTAASSLELINMAAKKPKKVVKKPVKKVAKKVAKKVVKKAPVRKSPAKSYASMQRDSKGPFDDIYKLVGETIEALGALGKK